MTFQPGAALYTTFGIRPENIEVPHYDVRPPATTDYNFPLGKLWIDKAGIASYQLLQITTSVGVTSGYWYPMAGTGAGIEVLAGSSGSATGFTVTLSPGSTGLTYTGSGSTMTTAGVLVLANGGSGASLSAVNGGIVYSGASAMGISAAGSSGQILQSAGAASPVWTTATYPATAGSSGNVITSNGTNFVSAAPVFTKMPWNSIAIGTAASSNNGYFASAALTLTFPASPAQGDQISVATSTGSNVVLNAGVGQFFKVGAGTSSSGGSATSSAAGNSITLIYQTSDSTWYSIGAPQGTWVLA